jgi:hypothetical protein
MDPALIVGVVAVTVAFVAVSTSSILLIQSRRLERNAERAMQYQLSYLDRATDVGARSTSSSAVLDELLARIGNERSVIVNVGGGNTALEDSRKSVESSQVREIAHAMNTPLSQIEAAALTIERSLLEEEGGADRALDLASLKRIRASVDLCKSFLAAYREVANVERTASEWNPKSLSAAVQAAAKVYNAGGAVQVDLPTKFSGYSNTFILAAVLPLLENALEIVGAGEPVLISGSSSSGSISISIENAWRGEHFGREVYAIGYSTKTGHEGIGISSVADLLSTRGGKLTHKFDGDRVAFMVSLPEASRGDS